MPHSKGSLPPREKKARSQFSLQVFRHPALSKASDLGERNLDDHLPL